MAGKIKVPSELVPSQSNQVMLRSKYVYDDVKGHTQEEVNAALEEQIESKVIEAGGVNWDIIPTAGSDNAVKSKDIKASLEKVTGYFVLDSNVTEATVAKTVTVSDFPNLALGGSIKIKMLTKNTADNPTLRIGTSNAPVYPLYYNNERVSADNTWEEGEVISVYFDGSNYQASNAQGGGGKAEKIKYDNSQSGLVANNVQGALDEIDDELTELGEDIYTSTGTSNIYIDGSDYKWKKVTGFYCKLIPITAGSTYLITAGTGNAQYTFLTSSSYTQSSAVSTWATGYTNQMLYTGPGTSVQVAAPSDAHYLYILCSTNGTDRNHTVREIISKIGNIDLRLDSIESKFVESDGETITVISGGYWHKDYGRFYEESAYSYTNAIRVTPGQRIKVSVSVGTACYGVAGSSTSTFSTNTIPLVGASTQVTNFIVTIPTGINYIFISSRNENFSTPFTPSAEFLAYSWLDVKIAEVAAKKCQPNVLVGKKLVTLGDSITQGQVIDGTVPENPWPVLVANSLGMELVNFGIGGSTIGTCTNYGGTFASVADFNAATKDTTKYYVVMTGNQTYSDYRYNGSSWVTTTIAMRTPLVDRYDLMDNDADIILVAGGTNDFQYNWAEIGEITDNVKTTFRGALNVLCNGLITKYPQKCIIFMTPIKRCQTQQAAAANSDTTAHRGGSYGTIDSQNDFGKTLKEYGDIIKEMCARYSIPVIDMYAECMLNPQLSAQSSLFDSYKTHPYQAAHNMMARLIVGKLREIFGANYT